MNLTKAEVKKCPNNAGVNANVNATKDDEEKEESNESNVAGDGVPLPHQPYLPLRAPQAKSLPKRPKEFGLIDTLMEKLNTRSPNAIRTALNALADVLKDDEKFRIYFRSSGHFEKLIEIFYSEDASLLADSRRKFDIALLKTLRSSCINRKNQQLFIKKQGLATLTSRSVDIISTNDGKIDVDASLAIGEFLRRLWSTLSPRGNCTSQNTKK